MESSDLSTTNPCETEFFSQGKYEQLRDIEDGFITDDQLEQFLTINFNHLGLKRGINQDEDVSLISWYTKMKLLVAIELFCKLSMLSLEHPGIIPYILNIVNENSARIELTPTKFKGKLFPPQASIINRMLELEERPNLIIMGESSITIHGGLLNERLSFGKTFCLPALICEKLIPYESDDVDNFIQTNLVICGTKVAKEWKNNLKNFTTLDYQVIERNNHLDILKEYIFNKGNYPEVLVVKDGDITWNGKKCKALEHVLEILKNKTFARIIYDDYDMIKLQPKSDVPDALFVWFVSGTDGKYTSPNINFYSMKNGEKSLLPLSTAKILMDAIASIKCNVEYSTVEYNVPRIDCFTLKSTIGFEDENYDHLKELVKLIKRLATNQTKISYDYENKKQLLNANLLTSNNDVPYIYDKNSLKILMAIDDKQDQVKLVDMLNDTGIKTVKLTKANVAKFEREDAIVCVAGNLFGVNMGFLTHIVINVTDFCENEFTQIIGRGQRLSRKQNLQVYFAEF